MKPDAGLELTREARRRVSHEHGNDLRRLGEFLMEYQRQFSHRLRWAPGPGDDSAVTPSPAAVDGDARRS